MSAFRYRAREVRPGFSSKWCGMPTYQSRHQIQPDGWHKVILADPESGHTQVVVHADLYTALCEAATACGFDVEDE